MWSCVLIIAHRISQPAVDVPLFDDFRVIKFESCIINPTGNFSCDEIHPSELEKSDISDQFDSNSRQAPGSKGTIPDLDPSQKIAK